MIFRVKIGIYIYIIHLHLHSTKVDTTTLCTTSHTRLLNGDTGNVIMSYGTHKLSLPKVRSTKHGLRSFRYFAAKTWNALPDSIRAMAGTKEFLRSIRHVAF